MTRDKIRPILPVPGPKPPWSLSPTLVTVIVAAIAAMPPTIVALAAFWQGQRLAVKTEVVAKTVEKVHVLTNSNMGISLRIGAVALRRVADLTKNAKDIATAEEAEKLLAAHEAAQKVVDAKAGQKADLTP